MIAMFRTAYKLLCIFLLILIAITIFSSIDSNPGTIIEEILDNILDWSPIKSFRRDTSNMRVEKAQTEAIMIVSYMRSGSTFTADILQQSPEIFYIYEPFKPIKCCYYKANKMCHGSSGICRLAIKKIQRTFNDTFNILTCNFHKLRKIVLSGLPENAFASQRQESYKECLSKYSDIFCMNKLNFECRQNIPMIKTIRLALDFVLNLFNKLPRLKVIHLLRDPRAVIYSRLKGGYFRQANASSLSKLLCARMLEDVQRAEIIKVKYPSRLFTLFYEDLAEHPIKGLESLYDFTKLKLNSKIKAYVNNITRSKKDNGYFSTRRANSKKAANQWRKRLKWSLVREIDRSCSQFYQATGYRKISSKSTLSNLKIDTFKRTIYNPPPMYN